jgi:hypothetical protein
MGHNPSPSPRETVFQHCIDAHSSNSVKLHLLKKNEGIFFFFGFYYWKLYIN